MHMTSSDTSHSLQGENIALQMKGISMFKAGGAGLMGSLQSTGRSKTPSTRFMVGKRHRFVTG